jgi:hypothetical protein
MPDQRVPDRCAPDRYADAVRARRAELRAQLARLAGSHRSDLRGALALSRVATAAGTAAALAELRREVGQHIDHADPAMRQRLPATFAAALDDSARSVFDGWAAALRPALRRIATERSLPVERDWPRLPVARPLSLPAPPPPVRSLSALGSGVLHGAALGRLLLIPLAVLPLWGLPLLGGPALIPLAVGAAIAATVFATRSRRAAADRSRLRRHVEVVLAAAGVALDADLGRRLIELEHSTAAALDVAVSRRRAEVEAELAELAPARPASARTAPTRPVPAGPAPHRPTSDRSAEVTSG